MIKDNNMCFLGFKKHTKEDYCITTEYPLSDTNKVSLYDVHEAKSTVKQIELSLLLATFDVLSTYNYER